MLVRLSEDDERVRRLRAAYAAIGRGDIDGALEALPLAPTVELLEPPQFAAGGHYRGAEQAERYFRRSRAGWEELELVPEAFLDAGERVVVLLRARGQPTGGGEIVEAAFADVVTIVEGRLLRIEGLRRSRRRAAVGHSWLPVGGVVSVRLAIVSDIHGNLTALDAVISDIERRAVERVIHGGDLALAGCQGVEVIDHVRELGWPGIVGNTDELLWRPEEHAVQRRRAPKLHDLLRVLFEDYAPATRELVGQERMEWLRALPRQRAEDDLTLVHASPGDLWRAAPPDAEDSELVSTYGACGTRMVVYGHIHRPYVRRIGDLVVANSGSVGSPVDGDPRASYLLIDAGEPQVVRVDYDVEREVALLLRSGYPDAMRLAETRRRGRFVPVNSSG